MHGRYVQIPWPGRSLRAFQHSCQPALRPRRIRGRQHVPKLFAQGLTDMKSLSCSAVSCVHNHDQQCSAKAILVSKSADETFCDTYTDENSFVAAAYLDTESEFGEELSAPPNITCNVSGCAYNQSFRCHAHAVKIDDPHDTVICNCLTYRPK